MKKTIIAALTVATLAILPMTSAAAMTWTGKETGYAYNHNYLNPYNVQLNTGASIWLFASTIILNCRNNGVSDGSKISTTNLSRLVGSNVKVNTTPNPSTVTCV